MIQNSQSYSKIPLFIGVDEEGGIVSRLGANPKMGVKHFPNMYEIGKTGDTDRSFEVGETLGKQLSQLGFNMDFALDADVLVNPNNQEIGKRSFGADPRLTADMVTAQIKGFHEAGLCAAAKHFPGHGSTATDSHKGFSASARTMEQLRAEELLPFRAAVEADVDFILVSHMTLTEIEPDGLPSTLSETIVTKLLKEELGFRNIVITDSLSMGAVTEEYGDRAALMAFEAGADMLLMPQDLNAAHRLILDAVRDGSIQEERVDESVLKILSTKLYYKIIT